MNHPGPGGLPDDDALAAIRTIDLTTTGRTSGRPSRIEIWWHRVAGRFIITGTPGPRDWYANALAEPAVIVHVGLPDGMVDLPATASRVEDAAFRRAVFTDPETSWYAANAELEDLIATAPMVELQLPAIGGPA